VRAQCPEEPRSDTVRRAVRAVEHEPAAAEIETRRETRPEPLEIPALGAGPRTDASDPSPGRPGPVPAPLQPRLDLVLPGVGQLVPVPREQLDAIVLEWVVGGGQHRPAGGAPPGGGESDGRR